MTRPFIVRVRDGVTGDLVPGASLDARADVLMRRAFATLVEADDDGFTSGMLPGPFSGPFPTYLRASAPGYVESDWVLVPQSGPVSMDIELTSTAQARAFELDFVSRVRVVTTAVGQSIDRDRRGIEGRMAFDLDAGTMSLVHMPVMTFDAGITDIVVTTSELAPGNYTAASGAGVLMLSLLAEPGSAFFGPSTLPIFLTTASQFPDINMHAFPRDGDVMRVAGMGIGQGGALDGAEVFLAATFTFEGEFPGD